MIKIILLKEFFRNKNAMRKKNPRYIFNTNLKRVYKKEIKYKI